MGLGIGGRRVEGCHALALCYARVDLGKMEVMEVGGGGGCRRERYARMPGRRAAASGDWRDNRRGSRHSVAD